MFLQNIMLPKMGNTTHRWSVPDATMLRVACCDQLERLLDMDLARNGPPHLLPGGRILTEIDTEYFLVFGEDRPSYVGLNYCPFCGRVLSRGLWNQEKKKG